MGKLTLVLVVLFVSVSYLSSNAVEAQQKYPEMLEQCQTAEKATDNDYLNLKMNVKPKTKVMKCLGTCLFEKNSMITTNKMDPKGVLAYVKTLPIYNEKVEQSIKEIIEECKTIREPDRCEYGSKLMDCFAGGATKRGIKPGALSLH